LKPNKPNKAILSRRMPFTETDLTMERYVAVAVIKHNLLNASKMSIQAPCIEVTTPPAAACPYVNLNNYRDFT